MENMKIGGREELSLQPTKEHLNQDDKDQIQKWLQPSSIFCISPWMEMTLNPDSFLSPCCIIKSIKDERGRQYNLLEDSLEDYWNGWGLREIRRKMLANEKVPACQWCYYDESIGKNSKRQGNIFLWLKSIYYGKYSKNILNRVEKSKTNGYRVEKSPLRLDVRPTNTCNLKCRMCWPNSSSKIAQEQKEILKSGADTSFIDRDYFKTDKKFFNWRKSKEIWKTIHKWSPGIKSLYFTGGEPTLIKEIWDFIDYLKEKDLAKNIGLEFNTNCTQNPNKLIETFDAFRSVDIMLSVDGYREVQEYIRHPSIWKDIENNIMKMLNKRKRKYWSLFRTCYSSL